MSKPEIEKKKLDTKILYGIGIASTAIVGAFWLLNRHKGKKVEERAIELERRTDARLKLLDERLIELNLKIEYETEPKTIAVLEELRRQVVWNRKRIVEQRKLSISARLVMETCEEAVANCEHELDLRSTESPEDSQTGG